MAGPVQPVAKTKAQIMADVQNAVASSGLARVVVANPWATINQNGLKMQSGYTAWAPEPLGPAEPAKTLTNISKAMLSPELQNKSDEEIYAALRKTYLAAGKQKLAEAVKKPAAATCPDISCMVVALLGSKFQELLNPTSTVEVCKMATPGQSPHFLVVVDRLQGSTLSDSGTWGPNAFIVDQWYALQRTPTTPGARAVKDIDPNGALHDPAFMTFYTTTKIATKAPVVTRLTIFTGADFGA